MKKTIAAALLAWGLVGQASAITTYASVTGYGLALDQDYGFTDRHTDGQTARVLAAPFQAPFGSAGFWGPADTLYPVIYQGMAEASATNGVLKARFRAEQEGSAPFRFGSAQAEMDGIVTLSGQPGAEVSTRITLEVDGLLSLTASADSTLFVASLSDPARTWSVSKSVQNDEGDTRTFVQQLSLDISGVSGERFRVFQRLTANANSSLGFGLADFENTSILSFAPASGTSVVGLDGYLAQAPVLAAAVPEPETATLALVGLMAGWMLRRRQAATCSG